MGRVAVSLLLAAPLFLGCGGSDEGGLVPVSGVVLLDDKPVANAAVAFHHPSGRIAYAVTDNDGGFHLTSGESGDGAPTGQHHVTVSLSIQEGGVQADAHGVEDYTKPVLPEKRIDVVPALYNDPATSPLLVTIAKRTTGLRLELQSEKR
jgi:hypothetical protein